MKEIQANDSQLQYRTSAASWITHGFLSLMTAGLWIPAALIIENQRGKKAKNKLSKKNRMLIQKNQKIRDEIDDLHKLVELRKSVINRTNELENLNISGFQFLTFTRIGLLESREVSRVTDSIGTFDATTKTGTLGVSGQRFGAAISNSSTKGNTQSKSVTGQAVEGITLVDKGRLVVTGSSISFSGSQFTKSATFLELVTWSAKTDTQLLISSRNESKVWILDFRYPQDALLAFDFLRFIDTIPSRAIQSNNFLALKERFFSLIQNQIVEIEGEIERLSSSLIPE